MALHSNKTRLYENAPLYDLLSDNFITQDRLRNGAIALHRLPKQRRHKSSSKPWNSAAIFNLKQNLSLYLPFVPTVRSFMTVTCAVFCIAFALAGRRCTAQQLPRAPEPHPTSPQPHEPMALAESEKPGSYSSSALPAFAPSAVFSIARPAPAPRIADTKFFLVNGIHLGMAIADVELTQRCIANHQCHEANPLMPSSQAGQLSIGIGYTTLASIASYWLKKQKSSHWWIPPAAGMAGHAAGIATGIHN